MIKSGFSGYKSKSAKTFGRKNIADNFSTIDGVIKSIIGTENVQIFTTLAPQTLVLDSSNNISRWDPLGYSNANCFLTKSGNTPTYDTTYKLGKFGGVRSVANQGLVQNTAESSASFDKTYIMYMRQNLRGGFGTSEVLFAHAWNDALTCATSRVNTNNNSNFTYYNYMTASGGAIKGANSNTFASVLLPISSSTFRVFQSNILSNRTGSQAVYDSNKSLIVAGASYPGTLINNNSSYTFSPSSISATNTDWDANYISGFPASKINLLTNANDSMFYTLIYVPSTLTTTQVQRIKLLLDKLYGA